MDQQKLQALFKLQEKAKRMEKYGKYTEALDIYMQIHKDFFPNTSDLYERPIVLLEKKGKFQEAYDLCKIAIERIESKNVSGTTSSFEKRLAILEKKLNGSPDKNIKKSKKKLFNPLTWELIDWLILFAIIIIISTLLYLFAPNASQYEDIEVNTPTSEENNSKALGTDDRDKDDEKNPYPITEEMIKQAQEIINKESDITDSGIFVTNDTIGFALFIKPSVSKVKAEEYAIIFIKALSSIASSTYTELSAPNAINFGELYKHYNCFISVGESADNILVKGDKPKSKTTINWID